MRVYKIVENFETKCPNPIILNIGEKVSLKNSEKVANGIKTSLILY